jgi:MSHA biogenesis protein MshI
MVPDRDKHGASILIPFFNRRRADLGLTGIGIHGEGACVARVERAVGRPPLLTRFDFRPWEGGSHDQQNVLAGLAAEHDLNRARCTTVLDASDYSLLLTEAPDVPADELRAALRWRIKDLIDFHINDATLDVFEVPGEKVSGRARPMYAVAARSTAIRRHVDLFDAAGVNLDVIDIPELAQRNIAALLPEDAKGVVLLSLTAVNGLITITKQGELYLSRNIDVGLDKLREEENRLQHIDYIVLEVQRSLDYFDSHFRQAPIGHLVLAPMAEEVPGLLEQLNANLNVDVYVMELSNVLECRAEIAPPLQARGFISIGAALRQEETAL